MATIIPYQTGQIEAEPYRPAPVSTGAAITRGAAVLGQGLQSLATDLERISARNDAISAREAMTDFQNKALEIGMGEGGYYRLRGKDALAGYQKYIDQLKEIQSQAGGALSPRARQLFTSQLGQEVLRERQRAMGFYLQEQDNYEKSVLSGAIATAKNTGAAHFNDSEQFEKSLHDIAQAVTIRGTRSGLDDKDIEAEVMRHQSEMVEQAAAVAAEYGAPQLGKVLEDYGHLLDGATRSKLEKAYAEKAEIEIGIAAASEIAQTGAPLSQQFAMADEKFGDQPELNKLVRANLSTLDHQRKQAEAEQDDAQLESEMRKFRGNPAYGLNNIPITMSPSGQRAMARMINLRNKGETVKSTADAIADMYAMPAHELAKINPETWRLGELSDEHREALSKMAGEARNSKTVARGEVTSTYINMRITQEANELFPGENGKRDRAAFTVWVNEQLLAVENPTKDTVDEIISRGSKSWVVDKDYFGDDTARGYQIAEEEIGDIDAETSTEIQNAMRAVRGPAHNPTTEEVAEVYRTHVSQGVPVEDVIQIWDAWAEEHPQGGRPSDDYVRSVYLLGKSRAQ